MIKLHESIAARFRTNLRLIRLERGLSQARLASRMGISDVYLGHLERGRRTPSLGMIEMVAHALGVDPGRLLKEA